MRPYREWRGEEERKREAAYARERFIVKGLIGAAWFIGIGAIPSLLYVVLK